MKKVAPPFLCPLTDMWTLLRLMLLIKRVGVERMNPIWPWISHYTDRILVLLLLPFLRWGSIWLYISSDKLDMKHFFLSVHCNATLQHPWPHLHTHFTGIYIKQVTKYYVVILYKMIIPWCFDLVPWYMSKMWFLVPFKRLLHLNQNFCFELSCGSLIKNWKKNQSTWLLLPAGCGGELSGPIGAFTSPGYPNKYPANRECIWHIQTSPGSNVSIIILKFDVEYLPDCNLVWQAWGMQK